jgi:hypothetical protein
MRVPGGRPSGRRNGKFGLDRRTQGKIELERKKLINKGELTARRVTHAERERIAAQLGLKEVEGAVINDQIDGTTMLAMRNIYNANEDQLKVLYRRWQEVLEGGKGTPEDATRLTFEIESLEEMDRQILGTFIPAASEMGRNLNALRIIARKGMGPETIFGWRVRLSKMAGRDLQAEELHRLRAILDSTDSDVKKTEALTKLMQDIAPPETWTRSVLDLRRAGFLTGLRTQARNFLSNAGEFTFRWMDDPAAYMADRLVAHHTGVRTRAYLNPAERLSASRRGATRGVRFMKQLLTGERALDPGELRKLDIRPGMFRKNRIADGYVKFIFRAQGAVDQPWRQAAFMETSGSSPSSSPRGTSN